MNEYVSQSDEQLLLLAGRGDAEAEACLAERYARVVRVCVRPYFLVGGDSEDLIQEGMLGLLAAIRGYHTDKDCSFKTYAETCIHNRIASAIRSATRKKHEPLNSGISLEDILSDESGDFIPTDFIRIPEETVLARERAQELTSTFSRCLSTKESQVLELYLTGLSYREIADRLSVSNKAVDNAVQRIRRKLADFSPGDSSAS